MHSPKYNFFYPYIFLRVILFVCGVNGRVIAVCKLQLGETSLVLSRKALFMLSPLLNVIAFGDFLLQEQKANLTIGLYYHFEVLNSSRLLVRWNRKGILHPPSLEGA